MASVAGQNRLHLNSELGLVVPFAALVIAASLISSDFLTVENIQNVIRSMAVMGIIALGMTAVLVAGEVDLSVGSVAAFSGMVGATFVDGGSSAAVIGATLLAGLAAGAINGLGVAFVGVPSLIMTLGSLAVARGIGNIISGGQASYPTSLDAYMFLARGELLGVPVPILIFLTIGVAALAVMRFSALGRKFYAVGSNPKAARLSGIRPSVVKFTAFSFAGLCAGIANLIQSARLGQIDPAMGQGYELIAIAISVLGGASLFGGRGTIEGTMIAALIFGVLYNIFNLLGWSGHTQQVFVAMIIVFMAWLHGFRR